MYVAIELGFQIFPAHHRPDRRIYQTLLFHSDYSRSSCVLWRGQTRVGNTGIRVRQAGACQCACSTHLQHVRPAHARRRRPRRVQLRHAGAAEFINYRTLLFLWKVFLIPQIPIKMVCFPSFFDQQLNTCNAPVAYMINGYPRMPILLMWSMKFH